MEKLIYTAVSGADLNQTSLQISANNLANVNTPGFKADLEQAQSLMVAGSGFNTRYQAQMTPVTTDLSVGTAQHTGRDLDVMLSEHGFLEVRDQHGGIAYTRAGSLSVDATGRLLTNGLAVQSGGGDIVLPEFGDIDIDSDGTINILPVGGGALQQVERISLVSSEGVSLRKGTDGLFRTDTGEALPQSEAITLQTGVLEGSNVNAVEEMVRTMMISRQFEMNVRMMRTAEEVSDAGNNLISGNS